jgi:hypothetical protein
VPRNAKYAGSGPPIRASQRRVKPTVAAPPPAFRSGDKVRWNHYTGIVKELCPDNTALVVESEILGRKATWRLDLAALTKI